jgi:beta-aspartyl-peptidase (threonine type)
MRYLVALLLVPMCAVAGAQPNSAWGRADDDAVVMVVHGGAGSVERATLSPATEAGYRAGLERALRAGHELLLAGESAVDAVVAAIEILEDDSLFNAGRGAVLTYDGTARLDASIMDAETGLAGASAGTRFVRHPIALARDVMRHTPHVMLAGAGAEEFARSRGLEMMPADWFITSTARGELERMQEELRRRAPGHPAPAAEPDTSTRGDAGGGPAPLMGTVGALALSQAGHLAAGTSTGGMTNKRWDRIGDSPIIGAGTYASNRTCAVSATGHGEFFIRLAVAHDIHARVEYLGETCEQAGRHAIAGVAAAGAEGGVIALDRQGRASAAFNSIFMARGTITRGGEVRVYLFPDEGP